MPRALSVDRKERGSVLSTLEIEPRTPTVKLNCSNVHLWFSGSELKKSNTGAYPAAVGASQERFRRPLWERGVEAGHRGLVFDEFLNRIIRRGRVEAVLRAGLVGGEVVLGPWDRIE